MKKKYERKIEKMKRKRDKQDEKDGKMEEKKRLKRHEWKKLQNKM